MSTPAGGYFDAQGNYIPADFANQLTLPGSSNQGMDSAAAATAQANLTAEQRKGHGNTLNIQARQKVNKALQTQLKNAKTAAQKASINRQIAANNAYITSQTSLRDASIARQATLQNTYYEASGQYEKLLTGDNRDAYASLRTMFNNLGLGTLAPKIYEYAKQGYGADVITMLLQDTTEYKTRFAGNTARAKAGLPVLSPADYLSTETAYRQILQDAGLPKGFYDSPTDFTNWISGDVSPTEVKGRVDLAVANTMQAGAQVTNALQQLYGVDQSYITAYYLDSQKALPLLQKQSQAAQFGAEALKRGLALDKADLEGFATSGLSLNQVSQGFQAVAEALPNIQAIGARYGEEFSQSELERDLIGGETDSLGDTKRKRLASQERALFSGAGGATPGGLGSYYQQT